MRKSRLKFHVKFFPKTTKNWKFEHGNLPNENLDQEKYFKYAFEGSGENLRKFGSKLRTSEPYTGSYKKEED